MLSDPTPRLSVVGAGPGDPELLTLKGLRALQSADAVLYDALVSEELLEYAPPPAVRIFVGKRRNFKKFTQDEINALIVEMAREHGHVVRLKGGDPFVFGRGFEEMEYAEALGIPATYIPGISSSIAVPGLAGIPVTYRNLSRSFWVITATTSDGSLSPDIYTAAQSDATVVVLMGLAKLPEIAAIFRQAGKGNLPAAVLQNGSLPLAKNVFGTVEDIVQNVEKEEIKSPSVIVLGEVVALKSWDLSAVLAEVEDSTSRVQPPPEGEGGLVPIYFWHPRLGQMGKLWASPPPLRGRGWGHSHQLKGLGAALRP